MRIDYQDLEIYLQLDHKTFERLTKGNFQRQYDYRQLLNGDERWDMISSPYYIFDIIKTRDTGIYEIWYDYIKRNIERKSTVFDFGAGVGTLETMLTKRYPLSLTVYEPNLVCNDFIVWRLQRRGYREPICLPKPHYDYVISLDMIQRLPEDQMKLRLKRLLALANRCFIYINCDNRHPMFNEVPFDVEKYISQFAISVDNFHGLLDIRMVEDEN